MDEAKPSSGQQTETRGQQQIIPTRGPLTEQLINVFGEEGDIESTKDRETTMIIDGFSKINPHYTTFMMFGTIYANALGTVESSQQPPVGLKIHVAINPDSEKYNEILAKVAELCSTKDRGAHPTSFKVMLYSNHKALLKDAPNQSSKIITIYPNFINGCQTNVEESIRLVSGLREIMQGGGQLDTSICGEHCSGNGIFLRAGAITNQGRLSETVGKTKPFEEQVRGNLSSLQTDSALFSKEIAEAIEKGLL